MDNQTYEQHKMSPLAAGITGLILGIVGTAAIAMSDKQTRTKVTKKANDMKENLEKWSKDTLHDLKATGDELKTENEKLADELQEETKKVL